MDAGSATSSSTALAGAPLAASDAAAAVPADGDRAPITMRKPAVARPWATARPMPRLPPVTSAVLMSMRLPQPLVIGLTSGSSGDSPGAPLDGAPRPARGLQLGHKRPESRPQCGVPRAPPPKARAVAVGTIRAFPRSGHSCFPEFHAPALKMITAQGGIFGWVSGSRHLVEALG
jgi:hypothetical protein